MTFVTHEVERAALVLAHSTAMASMLTLSAARAVVSKVGPHSQNHFEEICAMSAGLGRYEQPDYLNDRL